MSYQKTVLQNGVRVITEKIENVRSICLGICITEGARVENAKENGVSHFIEHLIFKGTKTRSAKDIAIQIDSIGGEINGFTAQEFTYFYARCLTEHLELVWELLADILKNSEFAEPQIELERNVILEEIKSFKDSPSDQAFQLLSEALFESHSLAKPILGPAENVKRFKKADILKFKSQHYKNHNLIIAASGAIEHKQLVKLVRQAFDFADTKSEVKKQVTFPKYKPEYKELEKKEITQIHLTLGTRSISQIDETRYPLLILASLLGGGMSSRLFQRLREEEGLVYEITSFLELFSDTGIFGIYLVTDPHNVKKAMDCIWEEFKLLNKKGLDKGELDRTKDHLKGNLWLSLESTSARLSNLLTGEIYLQRYVSPDERIKKLDILSKNDILSLIHSYLKPEIYSIVKVGPIK